ncbi:hypothetical protein DV515_00004588 [Chloebia gouldiae]|uniref:Uncharacterized protein n=1 Tax=Chloebia gouldiae TaxID=44316 RepID=A0A3L8SQ14_CHLGU|nr:hypothetical protein DV515_00004588 [Chloebia gouldiae]
MVPAPSPAAACERRESVVSGEPRERRSRRRARFWRSRFGTSQHPEEGPEARDHLPAERGRDISSPPPPSLSSAPLRRGTRRRRRPETVVPLYRKGEPADAPFPRLGQASPPGSSGTFGEGGGRGGEPSTAGVEGGDEGTHPGSAGRSWGRRCRRLEVGRSGCSGSRGAGGRSSRRRGEASRLCRGGHGLPEEDGTASCDRTRSGASAAIAASRGRRTEPPPLSRRGSGRRTLPRGPPASFSSARGGAGDAQAKIPFMDKEGGNNVFTVLRSACY